MPVTMQHREEVRQKLTGYHVIFLLGQKENCQLLSLKETIELTDLKQLQKYLDNNK